MYVFMYVCMYVSLHVYIIGCMFAYVHICLCSIPFYYLITNLRSHTNTHTHKHTHLPTYTHTLAFRGVSVRAYDSINHGILIQKLCSSMYTIGAILNKIISQTVLKTAAKLSVSHGRI